jgi:xanthine dehydrogenase accessory factor
MTVTMRERAEQLRSSRIPFVHARVVLAQRPTSAKPGDEALVLTDGAIEGFVGGDCAEETVRTQGLATLRSGQAVLLRITPEPEDDQTGKTVVHNPCLSGGTLEIFLEPVLPSPTLMIVGESPIAHAMKDVGTPLGYEVVTFAAGDVGSADAVLIASHGAEEEAALAAAVRADVPYVGLIASRRRGAAVLDGLDLTDEQKQRIHTPAGLDLGARSAPEIALSVFAEILSERAPMPRAHVSTPSLPETAVDPVCGMTVTVREGALSVGEDGDRVYFCSAGCRSAFLEDPAKYVRP